MTVTKQERDDMIIEMAKETVSVMTEAEIVDVAFNAIADSFDTATDEELISIYDQMMTGEPCGECEHCKEHQQDKPKLN